MVDAQYVAGRVRMARTANRERDRNQQRIKAIRRGDYDRVAPGLFSTEFPKPLIANLVDTMARDIAEVMAPLPAVNCQSASLSNETDQKRQDLRAAIANSYIQGSRLQQQMFGAADRYNSFGFMAYIVEPDFKQKSPVIRVSTNHSAYYVTDFLGNTRQYFEVYTATPRQVEADYAHRFDPGVLHNKLRQRFDSTKWDESCCEVAAWYDDTEDAIVLLDPEMVLASVPNVLKKCRVRVVERPSLANEGASGQFDDVIWVQVARGLTQQYTFEAIQRAVEAPMTAPMDVDVVDIGPYNVIKSQNPQGIGVVNLQMPMQLFPEQQVLAQEQREGSRYPEGRSGSFDASIITGQGVQALMGTFDTQVQTWQRLNSAGLEDAIALCFEMDEKFWPDLEKVRYLKDNGAPRKITYKPSKDINGNYLVDATYGLIAGLDPNRALVYLLQAQGGGWISKTTGRRAMANVLDLNSEAEERQIQLEQADDSIAAAMAQLPLAIPQMAMAGGDPVELLNKFLTYRDLLQKGTPAADAAEKAFAPQEPPPGAPPPDPLAAVQAGQAPQSPGSNLLMTLAGLSNGGAPQMQANVSRYTPIQ